MLSMTGFAEQALLDSTLRLSWQIKSLNTRFFEVNLVVPEPFKVLEPHLRQLAQAQFKRGKLEARLSHEQLSGLDPALNEVSLRQLLELERSVKNASPGARNLSVAEILAWPGVLGRPARQSAATHPQIIELFSQTLQQVQTMREGEGRALEVLFEKQIERIKIYLEQLRELLAVQLEHENQRLKARLNSFMGQSSEDASLAISQILAKYDIQEELDRLSLHSDNFLQVMGAATPLGRRLDFLLQEMHREANTLAAKSLAAEITYIAIELKVIIEQLREQVQNIE